MLRDATGLVLILLLSATTAVAQQGEAERLWTAAREGRLEVVRSEIEGGVAVDVPDRYSATALFKAAAAGRTEVVRYLIERGANVDVRESFWGQRAIDAAFGDGHLEVVALLLSAGAEGREDVFAGAARSDEVQLARVAVESGPFHVSALERLRQTFPDPPWDELLARARTRPDPPPPRLSAEELERYAGDFEGWDNDSRVEARVTEERLWVAVDGSGPVAVAPVAEHVFRSAEGGVETRFFGRAGTIEGLSLAVGGAEPVALRRSVAEPTAAPAAVDRVEQRRTPADDDERRTVHWPSFRGHNGDGVGDGDDTPVSWELESGENVLWQVEVPGLGNSSPVIWGDRVFLTTAIAAGVEQTVETGLTGSGAGVDESVEHSWQVLAFDKKSGERLWTTEIHRGVPLTRRHFKASQASSTAVTDGEHLVAVFPTAGLVCLTIDGEMRWHHDLGGLNASSFFDPDDQWGFASSPILHGDTVILQVDVYDGAYLAAWKLDTGEQAWKVEREVAPSWSTPTLLRSSKGEELVVNGSTIRGYDPRSGEELWSLAPNSELVIARPVVGDEVVYVSAGYPPVKPVYAVRAGLRGDLEVTPGEEHGALLWSERVGGAYMPSPILYRGLLYIVHHNGRIVAYDAETGAALYKERFSRSGTFTGSPVAVNGKLYLPTEEGLLYVLAAGPDYEELAVNDLGEPLMATPAVSEGVLFVRTPTRLYAFAHD